MNIQQIVERKPNIRESAPARHSTLRAAAQSLSLRNVDLAACELMSEALNRLTLLCYERGDDGRLCNVDPTNGRLLVPAPWGRGGRVRWGLTPSEANLMRAIMFTRQERGIPLYFYDRSRRCWYLNIQDYADGAVVISQLKEWQITVAEYRESRGSIGGTEGSR